MNLTQKLPQTIKTLKALELEIKYLNDGNNFLKQL